MGLKRKLNAAVLLTALLAAASPSCGASSPVPLRLWAEVSHARASDMLRDGVWHNRRLQAVGTDAAQHADVARSFVQLSFEALAALPPGATSDVELALPTGDIARCALRESNVLPPALRAKFPTVRAFAGACLDGSEVQVNLETDRRDSMSASLRTPEGDLYYVDATVADSDVYMMYRVKDVRGVTDEEARAADGANATAAFDCGVGSAPADEHDHVHEDDDDEHVDAGNNNNRRRRRGLRGLQSDVVTSRAYVFRIALIANAQYSAFHRNNMQTVLNSFVTLLERVNGVYMRELGVFFQLIDRADELVLMCERTDTACWAILPNDQSLLELNARYIEGKGIGIDDYDIGHSLSTGSGGVATYPSLCHPARKARGTTGVSRPVGDPFSIDYVSHEIGHQLKGGHTFRDCGQGGQASSSAVEPGSGSTILAYAGICGSIRDLQRHSDPMLHPQNLENMRDFIERETNRLDVCGQVIETGALRPVVSTSKATCVVPAMNAFQLRGGPSNVAASELWYSWDRIDAGGEDFRDGTLGHFRSWMPTRSQSRFVPNLFYQLYEPAVEHRAESLPQINKETIWRLTGRSAFSPSDLLGAFASSRIGDFGFVDRELSFTAERGPLRFTNLAGLRAVEPYEPVTFTWDVARTFSLSPAVKIMMAAHTGMRALRDGEGFLYSEHVADLDWVEVGQVANNGEATLTLPNLQPGAALDVHFMIRSAGDDDCYFFDLAPWNSLAARSEKPTPPPTTQPPVPGYVEPPSRSPTAAVLTGTGGTVPSTSGPSGAAEETASAGGIEGTTLALAGGGVGAVVLAMFVFVARLRRPSRQNLLALKKQQQRDNSSNNDEDGGRKPSRVLMAATSFSSYDDQFDGSGNAYGGSSGWTPSPPDRQSASRSVKPVFIDDPEQDMDGSSAFNNGGGGGSSRAPRAPPVPPLPPVPPRAREVPPAPFATPYRPPPAAASRFSFLKRAQQTPKPQSYVTGPPPQRPPKPSSPPSPPRMPSWQRARLAKQAEQQQQREQRAAMQQQQQQQHVAQPPPVEERRADRFANRRHDSSGSNNSDDSVDSQGRPRKHHSHPWQEERERRERENRDREEQRMQQRFPWAVNGGGPPAQQQQQEAPAAAARAAWQQRDRAQARKWPTPAPAAPGAVEQVVSGFRRSLRFLQGGAAPAGGVKPVAARWPPAQGNN